MFYYRVPLTQPILDFLAAAKKVEGKLKGGFQNHITELLSNVSGGYLYLDDQIMGRGYRYEYCYKAGGWQDTHLPPFHREIERLISEGLHKHVTKQQQDAMF